MDLPPSPLHSAFKPPQRVLPPSPPSPALPVHHLVFVYLNHRGCAVALPCPPHPQDRIRLLISLVSSRRHSPPISSATLSLPGVASPPLSRRIHSLRARQTAALARHPRPRSRLLALSRRKSTRRPRHSSSSTTNPSSPSSCRPTAQTRSRWTSSCARRTSRPLASSWSASSGGTSTRASGRPATVSA